MTDSPRTCGTNGREIEKPKCNAKDSSKMKTQTKSVQKVSALLAATDINKIVILTRFPKLKTNASEI